VSSAVVAVVEAGSVQEIATIARTLDNPALEEEVVVVEEPGNLDLEDNLDFLDLGEVAAVVVEPGNLDLEDNLDLDFHDLDLGEAAEAEEGPDTLDSPDSPEEVAVEVAAATGIPDLWETMGTMP
jgi:hypothetical protein